MTITLLLQWKLENKSQELGIHSAFFMPAGEGELYLTEKKKSQLINIKEIELELSFCNTI